MKLAMFEAGLGLAAMTAAIIYGFTAGDFLTEGQQLLSMPWGVVSMIDLYTGFSLFSGWILYRERSLGRGLVWVALMLTLGFWTGSLYALLALWRSKGDWARFWMGERVGAD